MNFETAVRTVLAKALIFEGRASRAEFWWWFLAYLIAIVLASGIDALLFGGMAIAGGLVWLALLLPNLSVSVRRLHDRGLAGWWVLLMLIPVVGGLILLILLAQAGEPGENGYGPPPLA
jgi:uncharacterized membrane protein YhaH (DUF805 family)